MNSLIIIIGSLVGGIVLMYSIWFLINTQRPQEWMAMYDARSAKCLAAGVLIICVGFLHALYNTHIVHDTIRMVGICVSINLLAAAMYFYEQERK